MRDSWPQLVTLRRADWRVVLGCLWLIPWAEWSVRWRSPRCWLPPAAPAASPGAMPSARTQAREAARWVDAVYRRSPFRPTCLTRSLVLYRILRGRGIPCRLSIGLRRQHATLDGHAWVGSAFLPEAAAFDVFLSF